MKPNRKTIHNILLAACVMAVQTSHSFASSEPSKEDDKLLKQFEGTFILEKAGSEEVSGCIIPELPSGSATTSFDTETVFGTKCSLNEQNSTPNDCWTDRAADLVVSFKVVGDKLVMSGQMTTENPEYIHPFNSQFQLGQTAKVGVSRRKVKSLPGSNGFSVQDHTAAQFRTRFVGPLPVFQIEKAYQSIWNFSVKDSNTITIQTEVLRGKTFDPNKATCNLKRTDSISDSVFEN